MVTKTVVRNKLFQWHLIFDTTQEGGDWFIFWYDPNGTDMYKIKLDAATKTMAAALRTQIQTWMNQTDTWVGDIVEHRQLQTVTLTDTKQDWVLVP